MAKAPAKRTAAKPAEATAVVKAPPPKPMTLAEQNKAKMAQMLEGVSNNRGDLENLLRPQGIDFDFFRSALQVALMTSLKSDPDFFTVTAQSFFTAVFKAANDGLVCDGREAAIVRFGTEATYMPMVGGMLKKAHQSSLIAEVNYNVVTEAEDNAGRFEYEEGTNGFIRHRMLLTRTDSDKVVAAYAVVKTTNGGEYREVVPLADLVKIRSVSRATKGPRKDWPMEMDRKAPLRRVFKRIPHDKALAQLMKHDDEAYLKAPKLGAPEDDDKKVDNKALFAPKAVHKAETAETPVQNEDQAGGDEPIVEPVKTVTEPRRAKSKPADPKKAPNQGPLLDEMLKMVKDARNLGELAEAIDIITKHPRVGELTEASQNTLNAAYKSRKAELVGENDGSKPVAERRPLEAIMRTGGSPKRFESEEVWRDDILQKMGAEKGEALKQFWERNVPFITAAREDGYAAAARLFEVAHKKGLA